MCIANASVVKMPTKPNFNAMPEAFGCLQQVLDYINATLIAEQKVLNRYHRTCDDPCDDTMDNEGKTANWYLNEAWTAMRDPMTRHDERSFLRGFISTIEAMVEEARKEMYEVDEVESDWDDTWLGLLDDTINLEHNAKELKQTVADVWF